MKHKITPAQWAILVLGAGLIVSLAWNAYFYSRLHGAPPPLRGTYCTDASAPRGVYLIFDGESRFCRYTQQEGVLDDGTCEEIGEGRYALRSGEGRTFCVLQNHDGVYLFDGGENYVAFFPKLKDYGTAYGMFGNVDNWPEWLRPSA